MVLISLNLEKQMHLEDFFMFKNVVSQGVSSPDFFSPELISSVLNLFQHTYISMCSDMKYRKKYILPIIMVLYLKYLVLVNIKLKWDFKIRTEHHSLSGVLQYSVLPCSARMDTRQMCLSKPMLTGNPSVVEGQWNATRILDSKRRSKSGFVFKREKHEELVVYLKNHWFWSEFEAPLET